MPLPQAIIAVVAPFRPLFTAPTWRKLMILLTGTLLAHGRRTVCSALQFSGEHNNENWSYISSGPQSRSLVTIGVQSVFALADRGDARCQASRHHDCD